MRFDRPRPALEASRNGQPGIACIDIDYTLTKESCNKLLVDQLVAIGAISTPFLELIQEHRQRYQQGEMDYDAYSHGVNARVQVVIEGANSSAITAATKVFSRPAIYQPWVGKVLPLLEHLGFHVYAVTGGLSVTARSVCDCLGIQLGLSTEATSVLVGSHAKRACLRRLVNAHRAHHVLAMGDSPLDLAMLEEATIRLVLPPREPGMLAQVNRRGWLVTDDAQVMMQHIAACVEGPSVGRYLATDSGGCR